ncbi:MAG: hypothetical protein KME45_11535 [Stenomitos rutilans HA7619-LM2]|jgi:hypothetical protein|nr:hypothetical protein [Stenomitos rutilans HA7619-LM2]
MSSITTTGSSLKSTHLPSALLETALLLDAAEKGRNGANPGIAPKNNITITFNADDGTCAIAAAIPVDVTVGSGGALTYAAKDYLGSSYTTFTAGGDVTASNVIAAFVQVAQILSAAEKAISPIEDQPNNITVDSSSETQTITIAANLPVVSSINSSGNVLFSATDYL